MAYESHGFYPFHLGVFHVKIVVSLWLTYYCLVGFIMLASLIVKPILAHKDGKIIFRIIVFGSSIPTKWYPSLVDWSFFFFCAKMDDSMIKLNSLNYSLGSV